MNIRNLFTRTVKAGQKLLSGIPLRIRARFDAASTTDDNARHWAAAEYLSADAEANSSARQTLRIRSRYEVANNSYARGITLSLANDTIGTGARLQITSPDSALNDRIEADFADWAEAIGLPELLRTARLAKCQDGEAFLMLVNNPKTRHEVKLNVQLVEADRVSDLHFALRPHEVDGITYDAFGNPETYRIFRYHPGSDEVGHNTFEYKDVPAKYVIHYFRVDRPGQHRGVPEIASALPLFAQLRRFTLAVLSAAEAAADFAGILYTDSPAGGEADDLVSMDSIQLQRNMLLTMPGGWKMGQLDPKQPCSTYSEFKAQILNEIARCICIPFNVAAGNSSGYNYASGRLDYQLYHKAIKVERHSIEQNILNRIFAMWLDEYRLVTGITIPERLPHVWFWDGFEHVDPLKEANAAAVKLGDGTTTYAAEYAKVGLDWEREFRQIAKEKQLMEELGITPAEVARKFGIPTADLQKNQTQPDNEE